MVNTAAIMTVHVLTTVNTMITVCLDTSEYVDNDDSSCQDMVNTSAKMTVHIATALVSSSRLDSCNSLYHNIALKDILKLQCVHNCLARVITRSPSFSHSVPFLKSLHWLPVQYYIIFKICTITYQALSPKQPVYTFTAHSCKTAQTASII